LKETGMIKKKEKQKGKEERENAARILKKEGGVRRTTAEWGR